MSDTASKIRPVVFLTTASIITFSLTLLGAGVAILSGTMPLGFMSAAARTDLGSSLLASPILILVLALIFEATRIALRTTPLPETQPLGRLAPIAGRWQE